MFRSLSLEPDEMIFRLGLYSGPAPLIFDRSMHFAARLPIKRAEQAIPQ